MNGRLSHQLGDNNISPSDLQASLSRITSGQYDNTGLSYHSSQGGLDDAMQVCGHLASSSFPCSNIVLQSYGTDYLNGGLDGGRYDSYGNGGSSAVGSSALYHGGRYGLGVPGRPTNGVADGKMNGLHGPKHKRGDIDRECKLTCWHCRLHY